MIEGERRRANLGRGLDALFGDAGDDDLDRVRQARVVPIELLSPNPYQPRRRFDEEEMERLVDSVREQGVLQPILVRPVAGDEGAYQIIAGERRWRAAQRARLHEVPVVVREFTDVEALQIALVENVQRQDLTPMEEAEGYRRLIQEFSYTQEDLGRVVGKSRSHIANTLRLLDLPDEVRDLVQGGQMTAGHARALLTLPDPVTAARTVIDRGLNVRQTEALARGETPAKEAAERPAGRTRTRAEPAAPKDADTLALEQEISAQLGLKVSITVTDDQSGTVAIRYGSLEQLDDLLRRLSGSRH